MHFPNTSGIRELVLTYLGCFSIFHPDIRIFSLFVVNVGDLPRNPFKYCITWGGTSNRKPATLVEIPVDGQNPAPVVAIQRIPAQK